jgi:hypothetical protein
LRFNVFPDAAKAWPLNWTSTQLRPGPPCTKLTVVWGTLTKVVEVVGLSCFEEAANATLVGVHVPDTTPAWLKPGANSKTSAATPAAKFRPIPIVTLSPPIVPR